MKFGLKWVHMARYELILRLDGALWLTIIAKTPLTSRRAIKLQNQQNHAFLLTKSAVGTFGKRLISYRKIFLFFFLAYRKKMVCFVAHQWPLFASVLALIITTSFLNTLKMIEVKSPSKVAQIKMRYVTN